MDDEHLTTLYSSILELLQKGVPWAAAQIEETVRQGRPVARQVRRGKAGSQTVTIAVRAPKLREDQFAATEDLTPRERVVLALDAVERLLVEPTAINGAMVETMTRVKVQEVLFAEPSAEGLAPSHGAGLRIAPNEPLGKLLEQVRREVADGG